MSENKKRSARLKVALFLDDQLARLSSLGHRFESYWYTFSSHCDLETIGEYLSRRGFQVSSIFGRLLFRPLWILHLLFQTLLNAWNWLVSRSVFSLAASCLVQPASAVASFSIELLRSRAQLLRPVTTLAILGIVLLAMLGFSTLPSNRLQLDKTYRQAIQLEIDRGDFERVQLYLAKLAQLGIPYGHAEMQGVNQLLEQGKAAEAFRFAERLAPIHRPGLPAAHLYLALSCLRGESGLASSTAHELAAKHLEHLKGISERFQAKGAELPPELQYLEGLLKLQQNQTAAAMETFANLSAHYWPASVMSLEINSKLGRNSQARAARQELLRWTSLKPSILGELPQACYVAWYQNGERVEPDADNFATRQDARYIAEHWLRQYPADSQAAEACIVEFGAGIENLAGKGPSEKQRAASMLNALASMLGIQHRDRLANWLIPKMNQGENSAELGAVLKFTQESSPPAVLLEIMGTAAFAEGKHQLALTLLSRAVELEPDYGVAWNNLAVVAKRDRAIEFAFEAAQQAVRLEPHNAAMRLTRGMIAIEMKHWETAQVDLEWVLQKQPDHCEIHRYLAITYEKLGKPDKSSFHQLLAGN